ncbi:MAG: ABC-F family ATP-binding cassette domain-containing protein [Actinomycetia bacterium]|nr:ABC-F family ATP-binding cassette domain-containing protein [Actinomycetes bacterium]MCP5031861.1 ABC-F family ATP-binding cassette domain-containing protein [Actinomycetes bacterium]
MILVDIDGVTMTRPERDLLRDVSLTLSTGDRVGIVGINGTGKSTLLRILAGTEEPESGTVRRGNGVSIAVLDQTSVLPPGTVLEALGHGWEAEAILDRLGMGAKLEAQTSELSGGEARRVALAAVLMADADLLILDEPTNHLDIGAIRWLEARLAAHRGGLLIVAHDRHLLDQVVTRVVELDRGRAYIHEGGYDTYLEGRALREAMDAKAEQVRKSLAKRELAWLRRGAPARTSKSKAHIARARAVVDYEAPAAARDGELNLHIDVPRLGDKVIELTGIGHRHDEHWLFRGIDLLIGPRERLGIVGLNGSGKSTLLNILGGRLDPAEGTLERGPTVKLGYHDQVGARLDPEQRVREAVTDGKRDISWQDQRLMERFWFDDDAQWAPIRLLSGGEQRRLQLILVLTANPNVLLLDEPTNDLDLDTLRALEDFLEDWPGALILVSHDRAFLERTVDDVLVMDGQGRAGRYPGGYAAWESEQHLRGTSRRAESASDQVAKAASAVSTRAAASRPKDQAKRSSSTIGHELRQVDKAMAKLQHQVDELNQQLVEAGDDHQRLGQLGSALSTRQAELDATEERWLELSEELESR